MRYSLVLFLALCTASTAAERAPRPNILYFYVDDMGWGSIGPNGQAQRKMQGLPYVRTPNLDRLAAEGVNFTRGYGCHVCSPSRSSQLSGFHQGHTWADRNDPNNARKAMRDDDVLIGDALSAAGYVTGYWGKWGYGASKDRDNPVIQNIQTLPTSHGFTHVLAELHHVRAHTFFQPTLWSAPAAKGATGGLELVPNTMASYIGKPSYPSLPAHQNHPDYPQTGYCDDAYAFAALDFVRDNAREYDASGKPFFGLLAVQIPHAPFDEITRLPKWGDAYRDDSKFPSLPKQAQQWAAMVTRIDAHFGNILGALDDPDGDGDNSDSIADNTLVIFQSDNGGPGGSNNTVFNANGGLRGTKGKIQEGGIRVPLVMRWPAKIHAGSKLKAGSSSRRVVDVSDLLPTFCELAGAQTPVGIDGVSIAPTLAGSGRQRQREFIIHEAGNGQSIIRGDHKLVRGGKGKNISYQLYNLARDHAEEKDIAAAHPQLVETLKELLLGERVAEPRGFANTYHRWEGADGASTSSAENWSDYIYANAGITYLTDSGAPRLSWVARIENRGSAPNIARADADLELLGLEIAGQSDTATQSLVLDEGIKLTGRNEIRVSKHAKLEVDGGSVVSLRWIDIRPGGSFGGHGRIGGDLYNGGTVYIDPRDSLRGNGGYHEGEGANLVVAIGGKPASQLRFEGTATLAGTLAISSKRRFTVEPGTSFTILTAKQIEGTFKNVDGQVIDGNGNRFAIAYTPTSVTLTALP